MQHTLLEGTTSEGQITVAEETEQWANEYRK
jgi:hypothetical protein